MSYPDFASINATALQCLRDLVEEISAQSTRQEGRELLIRNPRRMDRSAGSFSVNLDSGVWKDFAGGDGGSDPVSLVAYLQGHDSQGEAARWLVDRLGLHGMTANVAPKEKPQAPQYPRPVVPVPDDAPPLPVQRDEQGRWEYRDAAGRLLQVVVRTSDPEKGKVFHPWTWCETSPRCNGWKSKVLPTPRPLFGLDRLAARPGAPVLVVEGEKAALAAEVRFPSLVAVTSGSSGSAKGADWSPLAGRGVVIWPDNDDPGWAYAAAVAGCLRAVAPQSVRMVAPPAGLPPKWDLADPAPEGLDLQALLDGAPAVDLGQGVEPGPGSLPDRPPLPGFEWTERGLCKVDNLPEKGADGVVTGNVTKRSIWIAPPFELPGLVRDEGSGAWHLLMTWNDLDGASHDAALPFELLSGEAAELTRTLAQGGMLLPPGVDMRKHLLRYLVGAAPKVKARVRLVDALGWQGGAFILPNGESVGKPLEPVRFAGGARKNARFRPTGTMEGWQNGVARFAVGNPRLAFAIACAFAGPLMAMVRPDGGGGFNLMGASSKGKSTCLEAAASVWECPAPLTTWRATGNGLEELAKPRNDGFLALDEMSQVDVKEAGTTAYMLANGSPKVRAQKAGGLREMTQWRLIFLSSGEQGLQDVLGEDGKAPKAGQDVRVPDIPCPPDGMFQTAHDLPSLGDLALHLKAQAQKHHGHAIRAFLQELSGAGPQCEALESRLKAEEAAWLRKAIPLGADSQVRRVAGRFALVAVAGELARAMGILPWPEGEASRAALDAFHAWLERRGHHGASESHNAIQAFLDFLQQHGLARFDEWGDKNAHVPNRAGTRKRAAGPADGWDFYITAGGWKEIFKGMNPRTAAQACLNAGLLAPGQEKKDGDVVVTPYQNVKVAIHGQGRVYVSRAVDREAYSGSAEGVA